MAERDDLSADLPAYVLGELSAQDAARIDAALGTDVALAAEVAELEAVLRAVDDVDLELLRGDAAPLPPAVARRLRDGLESQRAARADDVPDRRNVIAVSSAVDVAVPAWAQDVPSDAQVAAVADDDASAPPVTQTAADDADDDVARVRSRRDPARWARIAVPTAAVLVGVVIVLNVWSGTPEGPGLGVHEQVAFEVEPAELEVEASVVPHTWGTEVFLTMNGLVDGEIYRVELEDRGGGLVSAGTFIGDADLEVVCIMNGAVLREDTTAIVVSTEDGEVVMRAELDEVDFVSV
ncbi:MAG: hypothetical protein JJT89_15670 [Nitriliruptoraceae bacterium]|nr:hypothetical protein [Nitriliruptoraceae bacterium]